MFNEPPFEIQATSPWYPDAVLGTFALSLWTPERLLTIADRHHAPFSKGFVSGVEQEILLMKVTDHAWPIVCMARRIGYVAAIQLGEHYTEAYEWLRWDIPRFRIGLRPAI